MDDLIATYTKIKFKIGEKIIVVYYTKDGNKHIEETYLSDIVSFSHIWVKNKDKTTSIPFFSSDIIIESITFKGYNQPTFYNHYIQQLSPTNPFEKYQELKMIMDNLFKTNQNKLNERKKTIKMYLLRRGFVEYNDLFFSQKQKEEFELFFSIILEELSQYAKNHNFDNNLKLVCIGSTSIIYELGDKIIKIGKPRRKKSIPYCEYILQPIINQTLEFDGYPIHIEITQKVFALDNEDGFALYSEDERFKEIVSELEKSLYSIGLSTDDLHPGNVGILLSDNKIHFDGINFDTGNDTATSITNNNNLRILKKGRFVIIDLDSLEIEDIIKYSNYLKSIGYNKEKIRKLKP